MPKSLHGYAIDKKIHHKTQSAQRIFLVDSVNSVPLW